MPGGRMNAGVPMQRGFENSDNPSTSFRPQQGRIQGPQNQFMPMGPNQQQFPNQPQFPVQRYGFFTGNSTPQTAVYQLKHQKNEPTTESQVNGLFNQNRLAQPSRNGQQVQQQGNNEIEARAQAIPLNAAENENALLVRLLYTHLEKIRDPVKQLRLRNELLSRVQQVLEEQLADENRATEESTRKRKSDTAWTTQENSQAKKTATQPSPPQSSQIQATPQQQQPSNQPSNQPQTDASPFGHQELTGSTFQPSYPRNQHFLT